MFKMSISNKIIDHLENSPYKSKIDINNSSYLNIIIFLMLQFIQGQGDEQTSE